MVRNLVERFGQAIREYWETRRRQDLNQGQRSGKRDAGTRSAVTGGKHADGIVKFLRNVLSDAGCGMPRLQVAERSTRTLPGYFRPSKEWDLVIVSDNRLIGIIEIKSQVGSFGNNFNNRVEEALGSATDLWTAFREGTFPLTQKPWVGYLFLLELSKESTRSPRAEAVSGKTLKGFPVRQEFVGASYARRYEIFCERLVRERLYDAACLIMSSEADGLMGQYVEPNESLGISNFVSSLLARVLAFQR